ncbi:MAG TPA: signal peptidase II [Magnetospirillaceae bacterium]|jgi:signal peptidase II
MRLSNRLPLGLGIAVLTLIADQASKWAILAAMRPEGVTETPFVGKGMVSVLPILDFGLVWNHGVSFGVGNTGSMWSTIGFAVIAVLVVVFLLGWMARTAKILLVVSLGLIVGGALGNLLDRLRFGAVTDFIYVHIGAFDWFPLFNGADSAITVGAILLAIDSLFGGDESPKT